MSKIILHTRSFHPDSNFGSGGLLFEGDNRKFTSNPKSTSRIYHYFTIDLIAAKFGDRFCDSHHSENALPNALNRVPEAYDAVYEYGAEKLGMPAGKDGQRIPDLPKLPKMENDYKQARKKPRHNFSGNITPYREDGDQAVNGRLSYAGKNFAFYGANTDTGHRIFGGDISDGGSNTEGGGWTKWGGVVPDLDVTHEFSIRIVRGKKTATVTSFISGDGFPNAESFMIDSANSPLFLASHVRIGTAATQLPGGRALPMTRTSLGADWNDGDLFGANVDVHLANDYTGDGSPQEVAPNGPMTRPAWNAKHTKRDASGNWLRQIEDNVPLPRQSIRKVRDWWRGAPQVK